MALEKDQKPVAPKGQFTQIFLFMMVLFVLFDQRLRTLLGRAVGFVLNPIIGFDGRAPIITILLAAIIMVASSTIVRHLLVDWVKMARIQNTMRSYNKAMREATVSKDQRKIENLRKFQSKLMTIQAEMSSGQLKPMAATMVIVIPLFAWLYEFVGALDYQFFATPWNAKVDMFTTNGILFGTSLLPHWILFYSAISLPFATLLQKGLKYWTWREHRHLMHRNGDASTTEPSA